MANLTDSQLLEIGRLLRKCDKWVLQQFRVVDNMPSNESPDEAPDVKPYDEGTLAKASLEGPVFDTRYICIYDSDDEEWEWKPANQARFSIKEINKPRQDIDSAMKRPIISYDTVSNYEQWYDCNDENLGYADVSDYNEYNNDFARFYCYKQGPDFRYAICSGFPGTVGYIYMTSTDMTST